MNGKVHGALLVELAQFSIVVFNVFYKNWRETWMWLYSGSIFFIPERISSSTLKSFSWASSLPPSEQMHFTSERVSFRAADPLISLLLLMHWSTVLPHALISLYVLKQKQQTAKAFVGISFPKILISILLHGVKLLYYKGKWYKCSIKK